jgi:hypothetical protein
MQLSLLRTQLRIELLVLLNRVRLLSTRALAVGCRIIALTTDFIVRVYKRGHSNTAYLLVLAIAALVLYKVIGGLIKGR